MGTEDEYKGHVAQHTPAATDDNSLGSSPGMTVPLENHDDSGVGHKNQATPEKTVTLENHDDQDTGHKTRPPSLEQSGSPAAGKHEGKDGKIAAVSKTSDSKHRRKERKQKAKESEDSTDSISSDDAKPETLKSQQSSSKALIKHLKERPKRTATHVRNGPNTSGLLDDQSTKKVQKPKRKTKKKKSKKLVAKSVADDSSSSSDDEALAKEQSSTVAQKSADIKSEDESDLSELVDDLSVDSDSFGSTSADKTERKAGEPLAKLTFSASFAAQALTRMKAHTTKEPAKGKTTRDDPSKPTEKAGKGSKAAFMKLDKVWDDKSCHFKSKPSSKEEDGDQYSSNAFNTIRHFDYRKRYTYTELNIISTALKKVMIEVMGQVEGISLEEDPAKLNPDDVFLYLEELRTFSKKLKVRTKSTKRKSKIELLKTARTHLKVLIKYLDEDYDKTKKSLYPLLASGKITFDLAWALFKSNEIIYTSTYGVEEQPRAVQVKYVSLENSVLDGKSYNIEVEYFDYDGKQFGMAKAEYEIKAFKGARKISDLTLYPLRYHKDHEKMTVELIGRGKKFVELAGMQYKYTKGLAFYKRDNKDIKVNVDGRAMIDPATFRRLKPNYQFSYIKPPEKDLRDYYPESDASASDINESTDSSSDGTSQSGSDQMIMEKKERKIDRRKKKYWKKKAYRMDSSDSDGDGEVQFVKVYRDPNAHREPEKFEPLDEPPHAPTDPANKTANEEKDDKEQPAAAATSQPGKATHPSNKFIITPLHHLLASPLALGFAFPEKLWLEFTVSSIHPIAFNSGAFDSLIIPPDQKRVVRALVESHARTASQNIDDVIQGKGRGLVAVLHGPPGTGKTLTAEGIAEFLQKPLYSVSVGELGIKGADVERSLTRILDMAHTWDALLLLDEADVFLEARTSTDVGRNALVSIFLRMLEYFQGILFLTTNRVTVFDPAFASRIHIGLRYGALELPARKAVWRLFIQKVRDLRDEGVEVDDFDEEEMKRLAGFELNGREIKNAVRTAQSVALIEKERLGMRHFLQVLLVGEVFARDLKGWAAEEMSKLYM